MNPNEESAPKNWEPPARATPQAKYGESLNLKNPAYDYFPEELIALRREIQEHPPLLKILAEQEDKDVYIQILEIAAYCKILVSGEYTRDDMLNLCEMLTKKLVSMRTIIALPPGL
jgi:hypothetical protein